MFVQGLKKGNQVAATSSRIIVAQIKSIIVTENKEIFTLDIENKRNFMEY